MTLKQGVRVEAGFTYVRLTPEAASQNLRHFLNALNRQIYGNAARRYGKRVRVIPVLEGCADKRFHFHCMIDCPRPELAPTFGMLVAQTWKSTQFGYREVLVEPGDLGWVAYMTKLRDKEDMASSIDWMNYHNPP